MKYLLTIIISLSIAILSAIGVYKYAPLSWFDFQDKPQFGTSITTIQGTDTLSSSRTTINDNFSALNSTKIENSSTTIDAITTISNLVTVGTITSGTWTAGIVGGQYGGTASSTLSLNQVLLGSTTSGIKVVAGYGSSGQFLTSGGASNPPTWTTGALDQTTPFNFTGTNFLVKNLYASSTAANPLVFNGLSYSTQSVRAASSTVLTENGSGVLIWQLPQRQTIYNNTNVGFSTSNTSSTTALTVPIPANTIVGGNGTVNVQASWWFSNAAFSGCAVDILMGSGSATTTATSGSISYSLPTIQTATIMATSTSAEYSFGTTLTNISNKHTMLGSGGVGTFSTAATWYLGFSVKALNASDVCQLNGVNVTVDRN